MHSPKQVIAIVGPTCTGKTDLSIELAKEFSAEIIAADSRTIYTKMDIGTAKPSAQQQATVKHHALDILEPNRFFSVSEYLQIARKAVDEIFSAGKMPVVCGGTGLYAQALLEGLEIPAVAPQVDLRTELNEFANKNGNQALHSRLNSIDAITASRLNINDRRRIIRALEVFIVTGKPFSALARKVQPPYETLWIGLKWTNNLEHKKFIAQRLEKQLEAGLLDEIKTLWQHAEYQAVLSNAVNYKEFVPYLQKSASWENVHQQCIQSNYQLARKQMIWFNARHTINWLAVDELTKAQQLAKILELSTLQMDRKSYTE